MRWFLVLVVVAALHVTAVGAGTVSESNNCTLAQATLSRFKYETFYSWHSATGNWTNMGQSSSLKELDGYYNLTGRASMLEIQSTFFESMKVVNASLRGLTVRPDYATRWAALAAEAHPYVARGVVTGFFLGDELLWNNITWDQLNATSALVKATFPSLYIWYNEGGAPFYARRNMNHYVVDWGTGYFPEAVDFVSMDDYDSITMKWGPEHQYNEYLFERMLPHQRAWVVPPTINITQPASRSVLTNCTAVDERDLNMLDLCVRDEAVRYFRWIDAEERLVGMSGFHFSTYPPYDLGLVSLPLTQKCYQDLAQQLIQYAESSVALT